MLILGNRWGRVLHLNSTLTTGGISAHPDQQSGRNFTERAARPVISLACPLRTSAHVLDFLNFSIFYMFLAMALTYQTSLLLSIKNLR